MPSTRRGRATPDDPGEGERRDEAPAKDISDDQSEEPGFLEALHDLNVGELRRVIEFAEARIREREAGEKAALKARLLKEVQDSGFSLADLFGGAARPAKGAAKSKAEVPNAERGPAPVKYRGPNPGDTWSGRGREPGWLKALVAEGHSREEYLVERPTA